MSNDQGGSNTLTFDGKVPTNYNVVLNSTSDFGKIDFSNESGSLSFGIDSSSTLAANTYSSGFSLRNALHFASAIPNLPSLRI